MLSANRHQNQNQKRKGSSQRRSWSSYGTAALIAGMAMAAGSTTTTTLAAAARPAPPTYPTRDISIPTGSQLGMIVATHRHGVRTPMLTGNTSLCTDMGCGSLTFEGKAMLSNLGQYFANGYGVGGYGQEGEGSQPLNNGNGVIPTNPADTTIPNPNNIVINRYDPRSTRVVASSRDRAIQSGVGVVNGLYTALNSRNGCGGSNTNGGAGQCTSPADFVFPEINADPNDAMLYPTDTNPSYNAFQQAYNFSMYPYMESQTLEVFTPSELLTMGKELSMGSGECDDNSTGTKPLPPQQGSSPFDAYVCGLDLQDYMRYLYSEFGGDWLQTNAPVTYSNMARLDELLNKFSFYYLYGYDATVVNAHHEDPSNMSSPITMLSNTSVSSLGGYLGYPLATSMLADMKTLQPTQTNPADGTPTTTLLNPQQAQNQGVLRFKDYSAHDMTVVELTMAMGNFTEKSIDAPFAVALFFEVWVTQPSATTSTGADEDISTRHIRAVYGYPQQEAKSNHTYTFYPYALVCTDSNGVTYESTNGCPLGDYERFIATRGPHSAAGICYLSDDARDLLGCGPEVKFSAADATINTTKYPYPTVEQLNKQFCHKYRQQCPQWACASNSEGDYAFIAASSDDVAYSLDLGSNNCVRRFTAADAKRLVDETSKVDSQRTIVHGMIIAMVLVMVGFAGITLLTSMISQSRVKRDGLRESEEGSMRGGDRYGAANGSVVAASHAEAKALLGGH